MKTLHVIAHFISSSLLLFCWTTTGLADLNVVATTPDLGAIAETIGGSAVTVTTLTRSTEDPHFVDPKPSFIVKLNRADVLIDGGAELEIGWLPALLEQARNEKLVVGAPGRISCAKAVSLLEVTTTLDRSQGDVHAAGNPHYLTDPINGKYVAHLLSDAFCALEPASCDTFKSNNQSFASRIDGKMSEWSTSLAPFKGSRVVAYHNSWIYFAKRFGLKIDLFLEPKPGIPPTPAHLAEVINTMRSEKLRPILVEPFENRRTAQMVAAAADGDILDVSKFPGGINNVDGGYIELIDAIVKKLAASLSAET